jgi:hypothetical protein
MDLQQQPHNFHNNFNALNAMNVNMNSNHLGNIGGNGMMMMLPGSGASSPPLPPMMHSQQPQPMPFGPLLGPAHMHQHQLQQQHHLSMQQQQQQQQQPHQHLQQQQAPHPFPSFRPLSQQAPPPGRYPTMTMQSHGSSMSGSLVSSVSGSLMSSGTQVVAWMPIIAIKNHLYLGTQMYSTMYRSHEQFVYSVSNI